MDKILNIRMYISIHMYILCIIVVLNVFKKDIEANFEEKKMKKRFF